MSELSYWHETTSLWAINIQNGKKKMFFFWQKRPYHSQITFPAEMPSQARERAVVQNSQRFFFFC